MFEFLYLGNLIPSKGIPDLLEACHLLSECSPDFICHIAGADTKEMSAESIRTQYKLPQIIIHGAVCGQKKMGLWQRAQALVFPTHYHNECFPLVILEAMQQGLPVISTPMGAIPDMVIHEQTGLLIPSQDSKALFHAMLRLMSSGDLTRKLGEAAATSYRKYFTFCNFENNLIRILAES